jgi:hypothetical protein
VNIKKFSCLRLLADHEKGSNSRLTTASAALGTSVVHRKPHCQGVHENNSHASLTTISKWLRKKVMEATKNERRKEATP